MLLLGVIPGCSAPVIPPEVVRAERQEHDLWREGASELAPQEYKAYKDALRQGKDLLIKENARISWFRNYTSVASHFKEVLAKGEGLRLDIGKRRVSLTESVGLRRDGLMERIETLRRLSGLVNEGRLARKYIAKAEVLVAESGQLMKDGKLSEADRRLESASKDTEMALKLLMPIIGRYSDKGLIAKWRGWVEETERESRESGGYAIVVSKVDRRLMLYKGGRHYQTFSIGIGFNGSKDKLHAGDRATPEGRYRVTKKLPRSRYHKALLINYPNDDDRRQFAAARKNGLIPEGVGIGGLIEIHGGGRDGMTYGCVALENKEIDRLYSLVGVGTPVTIVGATDYENEISKELRPIKADESIEGTSDENAAKKL